MKLANIENVYFVGIGGIGMSAIARYFKNIGKNVAGYDKTPTQLTQELIAEGIEIHFTDNCDLIAPQYKNQANTLVVYTPAVPKNHSELNYFLDHGFEVKKRAEVLGIITKDTFCFAVAGTHGKTTTSSILGHILYACGADVTAFLGGIAENYQTNLIGNGKTVTVVEADEFDRSFLQLHPNLACVTSMDADHLDIYGDEQHVIDSFNEFANKVDANHLFINQGVPLQAITIGINDDSNFKATNVRIENGWYVFTIVTPTQQINNVKFALPGHHNLTNALIAFAMAYTYGIDSEKIVAALATFKGVRRRFSYQIRSEKFVFIDDYAHHPTEINAVHQAVRELYPGKKVLAVFQPHLYSRTRDFIDGFAESLAKFDHLFLLDIYPARELPIEGVTGQWLLDKVDNTNKKLVAKNELIDAIVKADFDVLVTIGAGDIGEMIHDIKKALDAKKN
ncbi:UDP-N-acetylmuramate--L-alanine ligase [Flavobacterium agricola]|uniref:UDP-N-acetylmuramate--L-alanine ligase n=1 Tax=Flavobacterium agricola TaxID=2870839 RepID=A0ABY6LWE6_9FLAO|nr:UDP-N-acetylmuramate--L-alanine ligase [Flavobacterium agricola]UYW00652.1 UDP-N-acetylmuramate--L-alanine ligase [Flavobacterium agricola]